MSSYISYFTQTFCSLLCKLLLTCKKFCKCQCLSLVFMKKDLGDLGFLIFITSFSIYILSSLEKHKSKCPFSDLWYQIDTVVTKVWFITSKFCSVKNFNRSLVAKSTLQQVYWYAILATCSVQ